MDCFLNVFPFKKQRFIKIPIEIPAAASVNTADAPIRKELPTFGKTFARSFLLVPDNVLAASHAFSMTLCNCALPKISAASWQVLESFLNFPILCPLRTRGFQHGSRKQYVSLRLCLSILELHFAWLVSASNISPCMSR